MKKMNHVLRTLFGSVLCAGVVACAIALVSCNDEGIGDETLLYGRWEAVDYEGYEKEGGEIVYEWGFDPAMDAGDYVIFYSDGTYEEGTASGPGDSGTWRVKGNKIYVTADGETIGASVPTLTSSSLVLVYRYSEPGYEYYERSSFRKVE